MKAKSANRLCAQRLSHTHTHIHTHIHTLTHACSHTDTNADTFTDTNTQRQTHPLTNLLPCPETQKEMEYLLLGLDLPPAPLFHDDAQQNVIPQVALFELLKKFDGVSTHECKTYKDTTMKTYRLKSLPKYLIMHIKRFKKNIFYVEKNPTIVNFPVKYDM